MLKSLVQPNESEQELASMLDFERKWWGCMRGYKITAEGHRFTFDFGGFGSQFIKSHFTKILKVFIAQIKFPQIYQISLIRLIDPDVETVFARSYL